MTIWLGIAGAAALFGLAGFLKLRSCTGHCTGCTATCERFQQGATDDR